MANTPTTAIAPHTATTADASPCANQSLHILLVEDVISDALLLRLALDGAHVPYSICTIRKGNDVLPWLTHKLKKGTLPDVMMLDLGLPCVDGFEILEALTAAPPAIRAIPIVILTGYEHFEYVRKSYNLYVPAYINKPCNAGKIRAMMACLHPKKYSI